jgi:peroxiredoxin/nitrate/TMAO reductase-like tetraheme cytochrome c subunit
MFDRGPAAYRIAAVFGSGRLRLREGRPSIRSAETASGDGIPGGRDLGTEAPIRYPARVRCKALVITLLCGLAACSQASETPPVPAETRAATSGGGEVAAAAAPAVAAPKRSGRPLPAFGGLTLDDQRLEVSSFLGRRLLMLFFNPDTRDAEVAVDALASVAELRGKHNFEIVGVAMGSSRDKAREFAQRLEIAFPVIDDSSAAIAGRLGLRAPVALLGVDAEGYVSFGLPEFSSTDPSAGHSLEQLVREGLRLPGAEGPVPLDGAHPEAPVFRAKVMDSEESFDLAAARGRPVVLIFFLHTCPHCHDALRAIEATLADASFTALPEARRPLLVGVEITGRTFAVREMLKDEGLDFFPVVFDDDGSLRNEYGIFGGVPDIFLIDAQGRIAARTRGWSPPSDDALLRMRLSRLAGVPVPMLLRADGYSGNAVCGSCHELAHETWSFSSHASAYDTLVRHGSDLDPECIGCHVVGWGKPGGFSGAAETPELEGVGCESCHGRGGPHQSPDFLKDANYEPACLGCHDTKHSLGFEVASFLPRISHAANAHVAKLSPQEKAKLLAERGRPGGDVLPTRAAYVGSEACKSCHAAEFEVWAASPHQRAATSLVAKGKQSDAACLRCHTTGFGSPGGFPRDVAAPAHPDLGRVGCESCHGPGGDHVKEGAQRIGTILSLGDKCDSCVILQICGSCHDDANDPGFEFEVEAKIEAQRHGTLEPGTGRPKGANSAQRPRPHDAALLAHLLDPTRRGP